MAKRRRRRPDNESPHSKRRKLSTVDNSPPVEIESIQTLQKVLTFAHGLDLLTKQGEIPPLLSSNKLLLISTLDIQALRLFLRSITHAEDGDLRLSRRGILLQYLQDEVAAQREGEPACFDHLVKLWGLAGHCDNEEMYPATTALLALFLSTISSSIEFQDYGNRLCHQLTQDDSLKIFEKGLCAHKQKPRIISQSLRLLTEIVSFDGGKAANRVYRQRQITFKRLSTFLSMRSDAERVGLLDKPPIAVRTRALRYLFANIKMQSPSAKREILNQGKIIREVFESIHHDSSTVIQDILAVVNVHIVNDETVPLELKAKIFTEPNLSSIAKLYNYQSRGTLVPHRESNLDRADITSAAHRLLVTLCTQPNHGVKMAQNRWFLSDEINHRAKADQLTTGESSEALRKSQSHTQIENTSLGSFIQNIRPYASILQKDLLLAVFNASPELVPDYFFKKRSFSFEPKLTATWIGYSSFLLSVIQLPVPGRLLNASKGGLPPPVIDVMEHILPQAMTKKIATKCLNKNSDLITLLIVRILIAAFQKFKKVIDCFRQVSQATVPSHVRNLWEEAALDLLIRFSQRIPEMKQVVVAFRSCDEKKPLLREALTYLLSSYYQVLPHIALEANLDISTMISDSFKEESGTGGGTWNTMNNLYLIHLLDIGRCSSSMRWWHKPDNAPLSPFTLILKLCVECHDFDEDGSIQMMMRSIMEAEAIICQHTNSKLYNLLIRSLRMIEPIEGSNIVYGFLDNCFIRLSRRAVHYYEYVNEPHRIERNAISSKSLNKLGLLPLIIMEQWPLYLSSAISSKIKTVTRWLTLYFQELAQMSGENLFLQHILVQIRETTKDKAGQKLLKQAITKLVTENQIDEPLDKEPPSSTVNIAPTIDQVEAQPEVRQQIEFSGPPEEDENHPGLNKWRQMEVEEAITTGAIGQLMLCFSSKYEEIRKQAMLGMQAFMSKLKKFLQYSEKQQIYLLSGEFTETAQALETGLPLPHFASVMAAKALLVLTNPLHPMYSKVNKFLTEGPVWVVDKLPLYWIHRIMYNAPTIDESHYKQVQWLLETMADGLRTAADLELYRRCHVFEPLVSLLGSPFLPSRCKENVVMVLYRCICVNGSSTLITRHGIMSWIRSLNSLNTFSDDGIKVISKATNVGLPVTDKRIDQWSDGTFETVLDIVDAAQRILST
ncbi:MAG: hypothetical protein Q9167_000539 [Letrouitia subvulpina]